MRDTYLTGYMYCNSIWITDDKLRKINGLDVRMLWIYMHARYLRPIAMKVQIIKEKWTSQNLLMDQFGSDTC